MLYDTLKIVHILSATLLLTSMVVCVRLWQLLKKTSCEETIARIQSKTLWIAFFALFQLLSGFTLIGLKGKDLSPGWIISNMMGFIVMIGSWFAFTYTVSLSHRSTLRYQHLPSILLFICIITLGSMIFLMANRT
jgi:uncharacterized membrane protein